MSLVSCEECKQEFDRITALHLWSKHKMTMKQYRAKHPTAKIVADDDSSVGQMQDQFSGYPNRRV